MVEKSKLSSSSDMQFIVSIVSSLCLHNGNCSCKVKGEKKKKKKNN